MNKNLNQEEFEKNYDNFLSRLFYEKNKDKFHRLETKTGTEFGVFRNKNSIEVKAITEQGSKVSITKQQLLKVLNGSDFEYYESYAPIIFEYIKDNKLLDNKYICEYKDFYGKENQKYEFNEEKNNNKIMNIKNIILYGAPGVGKTHNYQNIISMIEEGKSQKEIFDTVSQNLHVDLQNKIFEDIKKDGRVEFVTFHQSYSYEDFIEGFRPNESKSIELEDGIFKTIATKAFGKININKTMSIGREIKSDRSTYIIDSVTSDLINIKKEKDNRIVPMPKRLVVELIENIKNSTITLDDIKNRNLESIDTSFDKYMYGYNSILYAICNNIINEVEYNEQKNFYIVIDEINRGNISKIFGELITLIEEDKRDTYEVTLPYSKEKFKVPSNLYIIATMNSTDKSIATIDIALRRRFTFLKMKPNVDLVHVKAKELFNNLNKFIKENLNEDYMLGHSYFMKIENDEDLEFVKEYKIKPLLEEYFYADEDNYTKAVEILEAKKD